MPEVSKNVRFYCQ